jgi:hypothetical protein
MPTRIYNDLMLEADGYPGRHLLRQSWSKNSSSTGLTDRGLDVARSNRMRTRMELAGVAGGIIARRPKKVTLA